MANTVDNVLVGSPRISGGLLISLTPIALNDYPTDATTAISGMNPVGYIGEGGVVEMINRESKPLPAWGGDVVRHLQTSHSVQYKFTFLETANADVLKVMYGENNVSGNLSTGIVVKRNSLLLPKFSMSQEMLDGQVSIRNFVPLAQIIDVGDITYVDSDSISYEVTVEAYPDANGDKAIQFMLSGVAPTAWAASQWYDIGASVTITDATLVALDSGTSGTVEPTKPASVGGKVTDGSVKWQRVA